MLAGPQKTTGLLTVCSKELPEGYYIRNWYPMEPEHPPGKLEKYMNRRPGGRLANLRTGSLMLKSLKGTYRFSGVCLDRKAFQLIL